MATKLSTSAPSPPLDADFALYFGFDKDTENPERIFQAADEAIRSFKELDKLLCETVDSNIKPVMLLEEIETGSIKIWLRNILLVADDDALKKLDWKPAVGRYLVKAKYAIIEWTNNDTPTLQSIKQLAFRIGKLAEETGVKRMPFYAELPTKSVVDAAEKISKTKRLLSEKDTMKYITCDEEIDFDMTIDISPEDIQEIMTKETIVSRENKMILTVKKPDYLGNSMWDLKHGRKVIPARIEDEDWLAGFQSRKADVRPGDAIECSVRIETRYGYDNDLLSETYSVTKVHRVLENEFHNQIDMINPDEY